MSATAITAAPTFRPARPLLDTRPRRGKHRQPLLDRAARMLAGWKWIRGEAAVAAASTGALIAATVLS